MRGNRFWFLFIAFWGAALFMVPSVALAESPTQSAGPPPVEQPLVREGDFALRLLAALGLGAVDEEAAAESRLADLGIEPRSGWIADYPVTPAVAGELRDAVAAAADSGKLAMGRDEAMRVFDTVLADAGLPLSPYSGTASYESLPPETGGYLDAAVVDDYYYGSGPPVVTYYAPPPAYYYLYAWMPYPFWCSGLLFPGFYVLHDFHRTVFANHRHFVVSNHFLDWNTHRVFRIDPVSRFRGDSFSVKRGHDARAFISFKDRSRYDSSFGRHGDRSLPGGSSLRPSPRENSFASLPSSESGRGDRRRFEGIRSGSGSSVGVRGFSRPSFESRVGERQRFERARSGAAPSVGSRNFSRPSFESRGGGGQRFEGARSGFAPSVGSRSFSRPSFGSGGDRPSFRSGGMSGSPSTGVRSFSRPSWGGGGSPSFRGSGGGTFNSFSRGGGFSYGGRGRR